MLRRKVPAHLDANPSLHSICIGPASAARPASFKSLYRKRARTTCPGHPLRRKRSSDKALRLLESQRHSICPIEIAPRNHRDDRKAGFPKARVIPGNAKLVPSDAEGSSDERFENLSVALLAGFRRQGSADPAADSRGHYVDVPVSHVLRAAGRIRRLSAHEIRAIEH